MMIQEAKLEDNAAFMDKYSRQIGAYGLEAMSKLLNLKILIVGLQGVGMETAKNLVLAGPGAVTLVDDEPATMADLGANFFLTPADVGKPRAAAVVSRLQELNGMVAVKAAASHKSGGASHGHGDGHATTPLAKELVMSHNCVVFCNGSRANLLWCNELCRSNGVAFIAVGSMGVLTYVFSDFGEAHVIKDATGEAVVTRIITDIRHYEKDDGGSAAAKCDGKTDDVCAVVTLLGAEGEDGGRLHGIDCNDHEGWVELSDVEGMDGLNEMLKKPFRASVVNKKVVTTVEVEVEETVNGSFTTAGGAVIKKKVKKEVTKSVFDGYRLKVAGLDCSQLSPYENGGMLTQVKVPITKKYRSFESNLKQPVGSGEFGLLFTDGAKFGRGEQLHFALLGLWEFQDRKGRLPVVGDESEAAEVLALAEAILNEHKSLPEGEALVVEELDADVIKKTALYAAVELQPLAAYLGGVVAQEIVKLTGKYTPLNQWLHLDFIEVLPETAPADAAPKGSRYDHMITVFGESFVTDKLHNGRTFMVGCGALGCEFLKNFAMMGFSCGPKGLITVTDNDRIEVSNLSRQFLFRESNVGQPKSKAAAAAVTLMNCDIHVDSKELLVAPETETSFPDEFWEAQNFVTNALDNVKARLYVDGRCVFYTKPLLESGTLGTKCNVQVIVPHLTASYSDGPKDENNEDAIPMCTLRNFPSLIEHCIEWARAQFEDTFVAPFAEAKKFIADRNEYLKAIRATTLDLATADGNCGSGGGGNGGGGSNKTRAASAVIKAIEELTALKAIIEKARSMIFDKCIEEAFIMFYVLFRDRILQLTYNFPEDHVVASGEKFWTGAKRFPRAVNMLDVLEDNQHQQYIVSTANILAATYGIVSPPEEELLPLDHHYRSVEEIAVTIGKLDVPMWEATNEKIDLSDGSKTADDDDDNDEKKGEDGHDAPGIGGRSGGGGKNIIEGKESVDMEMSVESSFEKLALLLDELQQIDITGLRFEPAEFEKDQDLNFHIDFITAAANMRAWNYRLKEAGRHKVKMIAGKIIPALATTTASVCGLVMVEMLKILQRKPLEAFKDSSNNLGMNSYFFSEPAPPEKAKDEYDPISMSEVKCIPSGFTKWDKTIVDEGGDLTLSQFIQTFKSMTGFSVSLLFHAVSEIDGPQRGLMLYDANAWNPKLKELYKSKMMTSLLEWTRERYAEAPVEITTKNRKYVELQLECVDDNDDPIKVPAVVYRWAH